MYSGEDSEPASSAASSEEESDPCDEEKEEEDGTGMTQAERREANIKALLSNRFAAYRIARMASPWRVHAIMHVV